MKLTTSLTTLTALLASCAYASPAESITTHSSMILPSGIPATGSLPFSPLSFDTTAASSFLSSLSALISSESVAASSAAAYTPSTPSQQPTVTGGTSATPVPTTTPSSTTPTTASSSTPAQTGAATGKSVGVQSHVMVVSGVLGGIVAAAFL